MKTMWTIREEMRNQGHDFPHWVGKTSYQCDYIPDWNSYLWYQGWIIDSHTKFSYILVSDDNIPHLLSSLSFSSSTLPSPKNTEYISKMYFGHREPLGVSESCQTRIPEWSNPRDYWTDAVAIRCTWKQVGALAKNLGVLTTRLGAPWSPGNKPGSAEYKTGSDDDKLGSAWEHLGAPATSLGACQITVELSGKTSSSLGTVLVRLEIIATTYRSIMFETHAFSLYSHICIYVSTELPFHMLYTWTGCRRCMRAMRGVPGYDNRVKSGIHCVAGIESVWRCTWMTRSSEMRVALGAMIKQVWTCTWRQRSSGLRDALVDRDRSSLGMHLQAMIKWEWRSTWRRGIWRGSFWNRSMWGTPGAEALFIG